MSPQESNHEDLLREPLWRAEWVGRWSGQGGRIAARTEAGPWVTCFRQAAAEAAKMYWRHSGAGVSSRLAKYCTPGNYAAVPRSGAWFGGLDGKHRSRNDCHIVAFRSAKGRSFAERKTTLVSRTAQPVSNVVLTVTSGDPGEAAVSPASVTFTPGNWNAPQTVIVTGVDDLGRDGNQTTPVTVGVDDPSSDDHFDQSIWPTPRNRSPRH